MLIALWFAGVAGATSQCGELGRESMVLAQVDDVPLNLSVPVAYERSCGDDRIGRPSIDVTGPDGEARTAWGTGASGVWGEVPLDGLLEPDTEYVLRLRESGQDAPAITVRTDTARDDSIPPAPEVEGLELSVDHWRKFAGKGTLNVRLDRVPSGSSDRYEVVFNGTPVARRWNLPGNVDIESTWSATLPYEGEDVLCVEVRTLHPVTGQPGELSEPLCQAADPQSRGCATVDAPSMWGLLAVPILFLFRRQRQGE